MRSQILVDDGPTSLSKQFYDSAGVAANPGTVTVGIVDANGDTVVAAGTATTGATTAPRAYSLAIQTQVNVLYVTWTRADTGAALVDVVEVVGNHLFSLVEARAFDGAVMASTTKYPAADILAERTRITDLLEKWTGRSWVPRYCRVEAPGSGQYDLDLLTGRRQASNGQQVGGPGHTIAINEIFRANDGTDITTTNITVNPHSGRLTRTDGIWSTPTLSDPRNVTVEYGYGNPYIDAGVDRIALLLLRDRLIKSAIPDSALAYQGDEGSFQLVREGGPHANLTRLPEVNAWIADNSVFGGI